VEEEVAVLAYRQASRHCKPMLDQILQKLHLQSIDDLTPAERATWIPVQ
jgi:hypothetical protein